MKKFLLLSGLIFTIILCLNFKGTVSYVNEGLNIGVNIIMPSLFPFFVISDALVYALSDLSSKSILVRLFKKVFKMPASAFAVFVSGVISGYPVGASLVYNMYNKNALSKEDCEDLICYCNNSGPLFIICAIGCAMLSNLTLGIILYIIHIVSAILVGIIISLKRNVREIDFVPPKNEFNLAQSIENSFIKVIKIIGFVIFFNIVMNLLKVCLSYLSIENDVVLSIIFSFLEITTGIKYGLCLSQKATLCLISFSTSWSGLSVYFQTRLVTKGGLSLKKYVKYKLFGGLISASLTYIVFSIKEFQFENIGSVDPYKIIYPILIFICYMFFHIYITKQKKQGN